jgi:hypothetical protein
MRPLHQRKIVSVCWDDIQCLNEKLFRLILDPHQGAEGRRLLQIGGPVTQHISSANRRALGIAIHCTVPLVTFSATLEEALAQDPRQWAADSASQIPSALQDLTLFTLRFAQSVVLRNASVAHAFFGFSRLFAERFGDTALRNLEALSQYRQCLLRLRGGDDVAAWQALLVGDRSGSDRGQLLARISAYQMLIVP